MTIPEPPAPPTFHHSSHPQASPYAHVDSGPPIPDGAWPPPAPARRGLPGWAITLIAVGSAAMLAVVVTTAVTAAAAVAPVLGALAARSHPGGGGAAETAPEEQPKPDPSDMLQGRWGLDKTIHLSLLPLWVANPPEGWEQVDRAESSGLTEFHDIGGRCDFIAYEGASTVSRDVDTDAAATAALTHDLAEHFASTKGVEGASTRPLDPHWLWADDDGEVQFAAIQTDFTRAGVKWTAFTYARAFAAGHVMLYETVQCPTTVFDSSPADVFDTVDSAGIITY